MIRVYIHGRPQGQDIWSKSPNANDEFYLNPFLDSKIGEDMNDVLQIDMWQQSAYYSYIHRHNVVEKGSRPNAYFAITVCFEKQYCSQVATLYELLDTVYKQLCLNSVIEKTKDQERFLVAKFQEKENVLLQITNVIQQNIEKHLSSSLEALENKSDTTSTQIKSYSTVDVDSPQFIADCLAHRILVAPYMMAKDRLPQELQQKIVAIEAQKAEVIKERNKWQSDAEQSHEENAALNCKQKELQEQVSQLQQQVNSIKDEVRREYQSQQKQLQAEIQNAQNNISSLNKQLSQERKEKSDLANQVDSLKKRVKQLQSARPEENPHLQAHESVDTQSNDISEIVDQLKKVFRHKAGRFPFLWSKLAFAFSVINTGILVFLLLAHLGITKNHPMDNVVEQSSVQQEKAIEQNTDSIESVTPLNQNQNESE